MWGWWPFKKKVGVKDKISEERLSKLHPKVIEDFRSFVVDAETSLGITLRVIQGLRTFAEQAELYSHGRTKFVDSKGNKLGKVTNAKAGQSYHNYGLAIDVAELRGKEINWRFVYKRLEPIANKHGLKWGGNFVSFQDNPHFEKTLGQHWSQLLAKQEKKDFIPGTEFVNI